MLHAKVEEHSQARPAAQVCGFKVSVGFEKQTYDLICIPTGTMRMKRIPLVEDGLCSLMDGLVLTLPRHRRSQMQRRVVGHCVEDCARVRRGLRAQQQLHHLGLAREDREVQRRHGHGSVELGLDRGALGRVLGLPGLHKGSVIGRRSVNVCVDIKERADVPDRLLSLAVHCQVDEREVRQHLLTHDEIVSEEAGLPGRARGRSGLVMVTDTVPHLRPAKRREDGVLQHAPLLGR
mmetsp:Transcript_114269/g.334100  ORF Transcript_114269/g.334100 Transcript_114269/m.334100 type:complete len:235 (+) Transcript_114269:144-848(+)